MGKHHNSPSFAVEKSSSFHRSELSDSITGGVSLCMGDTLPSVGKWTASGFYIDANRQLAAFVLSVAPPVHPA
jgi:hypothetical protein